MLLIKTFVVVAVFAGGMLAAPAAAAAPARTSGLPQATLQAQPSGSAPPAAQLVPGDRLGRMVFVRGTVATADRKLLDTCDPVILETGRYERRCGVVPRAGRLFIGYGLFAAPREMERVWAGTKWRAWFDGHQVALRAFGSSDRTLYAFPAAGGKDVTLREWRVMLVGATPGQHAIRYRSHAASGTVDVTWKFTVAAH
jgi:hypothetical protein